MLPSLKRSNATAPVAGYIPQMRTRDYAPEFQRFPLQDDPPNTRKVLRIMCDENVPRRLINALGTGDLARARSVADVGLRRRTDYDILGWCIDKSYCLLTFDDDFLQRGFQWWRSLGVFVCRVPKDKPHLWMPIYRVNILASRAPSQFNKSLAVISADGFKFYYKDRMNRTRINDFRWFNTRLYRRVHPGEHLLDLGWTVSEVNTTLRRSS